MADSNARRRVPRSMLWHNVDGVPEGKLKARCKAERGSSRKVKKRNLKDLTPEVREEIVRLFEREHILQKDIAERFKVSKWVVSRLINDADKREEQIRKIKAAKDRDQQVTEAVSRTALSLVRRSEPIENS